MTATPSLNRVLALSGVSLEPPAADPGTEQAALLLSAWAGLETAFVALAKDDPDNDGDDDSSDEGDTDNDRDHMNHATFKAMKKKGMSDADAAKWCAKSDNKADKVKATRLGFSSLRALEVALSVTQAERDKAHAAGNSLPDKTYPINNTDQLHSAAVLAASKHGDYKAARALIIRRAKELGVDVTTLPGFGDDGDSDQKVAATMTLALAGRAALGLEHMHPSEAMHHGGFTGTHTHPHVARVVVSRSHFHNGDSTHEHMLHPGV